MGLLVEQLAPSYGGEIVGIVDEHSGERAIEQGEFGSVDVAVDFSLAAAVPGNLRQLAARRLNVVIGATGWHAHEPELKTLAARASLGVLASANFSLGMNIVQLAVAAAAARFAPHPDYGAWIHEIHHATKKDAPSGTALLLKAAMERAGYSRAVDVSSTRAGSAPGLHTVGFDGSAESVTFTHEVRDRSVFARGALEAAKWLQGRHGWFTMQDMLEER